MSGSKLDGDISALVKKAVDRRTQTLEKTHRLELKNVKKVAMQEAFNFVKKSCKDLTRYLTKQHSQLVD